MKHFALLIATALTLTACSAPSSSQGPNDPLETVNRKTYEANVEIDRAVIKPVATAYGTVVPDPLRKGLSNVSDTLGLPGVVINDILQFKLGDALHNTTRFALNATLGLAGLLDPASDIGLEERDSDFGETLHTWGFGEGAYLVLPVYGSSTTRDTVGLIADFALDPLGTVLDPAVSTAATGLQVAQIADTRYRYSDIYESIIYDSADGYAQLRLTYLDRRRFELGAAAPQEAGTSADNASYDIYEDFYE
ncbi:MAG: VacJ family lipoprotein [Pacificibacter sp.]|uniref:MlaA family lipoprotein n=1 Tax=Pacificibacter sp. TaxID=1917866 RepID=UPI00321AA3F4